MTTDGFGNDLKCKYKVFYEDPETKARAFVVMNHDEITKFRNTLSAAKYSDLIPIRGVGMLQKSAIKGETKVGADGTKGQKDMSHIVQYCHGIVIGIPKSKESGYEVERVNYKGREAVYTQLAFLPKELWDKKKDYEKKSWIEKVIYDDTH